MPGDEHTEAKLTASITYRVAEGDLERLDHVAGSTSRSLVARAAMLIGIEYFEKHPDKVRELRPPRKGIEPGSKRKPRRASK